MVHVGDQPVDLRRFHVQCQKYFNKLREAQIKSHCVRDKSPVKLVIDYNPNERNSIDIQKILDKGAAVESQDVTYLFRALDTFNKGHFHTHKLLLPWKIVTTSKFRAALFRCCLTIPVSHWCEKQLVHLFLVLSFSCKCGSRLVA